MNRSGFTIIELLVASMVASIVAVLLMQMLGLVNKVSMAADDRMTTDERAAVLLTQLERDLSGAFFIPQKKEDKDKKQDAEKADEKKEEKITKIFVGDGHGSLLTFITNNPLPTYWDARVGKPKPAIARVVYKLVEDAKLKGSYNIMRLETDDLYDQTIFEKDNMKNFVQMVQGIKELKIQYVEQKDRMPEKKKEEAAPAPAAQKQGAQPAQQKEKPEPMPIIEYHSVDEWDSDKEPEEQKEVFRHHLPAYVKVQVSFWDNMKKGAVAFDYIFQLVPDVQEQKKTLQITPPAETKPVTATAHADLGKWQQFGQFQKRMFGKGGVRV